jgi:hypothetical protein
MLAEIIDRPDSFERMADVVRQRLSGLHDETPSILDRIRADPANVMRLAGFTPDPWQEHLLRSTERQVMMLCSRQTGKSETAAALALATALRSDGVDVLIVSRALRQSSEMLRKVKSLRLALLGESRHSRKPLKKWTPRHLRVEEIIKDDPLETLSDAALSMELSNGSRIVALPGSVSGSADTLVGFSAVSLLILEEAARIRDEFYLSLRPVLAASVAKHGEGHGRLVALSTPFGKRGWFWEVYNRIEKAPLVWAGFQQGRSVRELANAAGIGVDAAEQIIDSKGHPGWRLFRSTYRDCPRISAEFIAEERASLGPRWFRQEYETSFEETTDAVFQSADIDALLTPPSTPKWDV